MANRKKKGSGSAPNDGAEQDQLLNLIGLGEFSGRKSYYPELQKKIAELEEEKNKYERIFSDALSGIFQAETDGGIIVANPAMVKLCGYPSREQLISISDIGTQLFADPEEKDRLMERLLEEQSVIGFETQFKKYDGTVIEISLNASILKSSTDQYLECFVQDITERKQDEYELRKARNYIFNIINSMPSVLIGVDQYGTITQWNQEAERATGVSSKDAEGQPLDKAIPRLSAELERIRSAIETRQKQSDPRRPNHEDGKRHYEDLTVYPLISNDVEGAVIRIDDVTDKVLMEEMMIQSEKMLSIGGLAAGMAHEINNPLAGIMQTANVMANRLGERIDMPANLKAAKEAGASIEAIQKFMEARGIPRMVEAIMASGRRVAGIVENMLGFARKSEARASSSFHSLGELIDKTLELAATDYDLKKQHDFKLIEIRKEYEAGLPPVPCDGAKIQQVLLNILRNGAQAMQEAGTGKPRLVIRTHFEKSRKRVCIEIEDNGPGMDEKTRKRVFEPFFTTKPMGVGTGLGLSVSYFIITEDHGGEMAVVSRPGSGAKFIIRLGLDLPGEATGER
ncbi:MAG: PAS domain S-box protein [Desulfobacteraceae bacterium]|nr:PAS domain S-box protein [Desulfobacteraceae bacterium]